MPYIKQPDRDKIDNQIDSLLFAIISNSVPENRSGFLNYTITRLLHEAYYLNGNPSYDRINSAIGVLECAKQELYRKRAVPYEEQKIEENGDV